MVPGKLFFSQAKLKTVLPGAENGPVLRRGASAALAAPLRRSAGASDFSSSPAVSSTPPAKLPPATLPLPITVYPVGTATLILAVKRLTPYPLTGNQRPA